MERSDSIVKLAGALVKAQAEFKVVEKAQTNEHFSSKYADFAQVRREIDPVLTAHGLAVTQLVGHELLTTMLLHESGEFISEVMNLYVSRTRNDRERGTVVVPPDPQSQGSAITYAKRYAYMAITGAVAGGEDDDGEAATANARRPQTVAEASSAVDDFLGGAQSPAEPDIPVEKPAVAVEPGAAQGAGGEPTEATNDAAVAKTSGEGDEKAKLRALIAEHRKILEGFFPDVWKTVADWAEKRKIDLDNVPDSKLRALESNLRKQLDQLAPPASAEDPGAPEVE